MQFINKNIWNELRNDATNKYQTLIAKLIKKINSDTNLIRCLKNSKSVPH